MGLGKTRGLNFRAEKLNFAPSTIPEFCHWSLNWSLNPSSFMKLLSTSQRPLNSLFFDSTVSVQFASDTV